eukprot:10579486-Alexandrium_andersonii.AAC.1
MLGVTCRAQDAKHKSASPKRANKQTTKQTTERKQSADNHAYPPEAPIGGGVVKSAGHPWRGARAMLPPEVSALSASGPRLATWTSYLEIWTLPGGLSLPRKLRPPRAGCRRPPCKKAHPSLAGGAFL